MSTIPSSAGALNLLKMSAHHSRRWDTPSGAFDTGKRNIFQSLEGSPDGLKIAANGYMVVGSGLSNGADIIDPYGALIARIQTTHPVENVAFTGPDLKTFYLVGIGGITRVECNLTGPDPNNYYI